MHFAVNSLNVIKESLAAENFQKLWLQVPITESMGPKYTEINISNSLMCYILMSTYDCLIFLILQGRQPP